MRMLLGAALVTLLASVGQSADRQPTQWSYRSSGVYDAAGRTAGRVVERSNAAARSADVIDARGRKTATVRTAHPLPSVSTLSSSRTTARVGTTVRGTTPAARANGGKR